MNRLSAVAIALANVAIPMLASADDVYLKDGEVVEGVIVSAPGAATIDMRVGTKSMAVLRHFSADTVLRVTYGVSDHQKALNALYAHKEAMDESATADDWWQLSLTAHSLDDALLARECANQTILLDRSHVQAHRYLGMVQCKGIWMKSNEVAVSQGLVAFQGRWMTWADKEAMIAQQEKRRAELEAQRTAAIAQAQAQAQAQAAADGNNTGLYPPTDPGITGVTTGGVVPFGYYRMNWGPTNTPVMRPHPVPLGPGFINHPGTTGFGNLPGTQGDQPGGGLHNPPGWNF